MPQTPTPPTSVSVPRWVRSANYLSGVIDASRGVVAHGSTAVLGALDLGGSSTQVGSFSLALSILMKQPRGQLVSLREMPLCPKWKKS